MSGPLLPGGLNDCVLVVDDEFLIAVGLSIQLESFGLRVCGMASEADEAVSMAQAERPAIVLMDVRLAGQKDGVDAACDIHRTVGSKVIFVTGSREPATMERIKLDHPAAVLIKPVSDRDLRNAIDAARAA